MSAMQDTLLLGPEGIKKTILHGGRGEIPKFATGVKVLYFLHILLKCTSYSKELIHKKYYFF